MKLDEIKISVSSKFWWDIAMPILSRIVYGSFPATKAELNNCDRDHLAPQSLKHLLSGSL